MIYSCFFSPSFDKNSPGKYRRDNMSLSAHSLRSSPYSIPPSSSNTCRLGSRPSTGATPYSAQTFPTQLQHHYFNPHSGLSQTPGGAAAAAAAAAGFSFQNSMLLPGSSQIGGAGGGGQISPQTTPSSSISTASSMPLPDSPVSVMAVL